MSQFERDLNFAIQQSLEEEKKKQEESNQNNPKPQENKDNNVQTPQANTEKKTNDVKMDVDDDEEAELEKARLMSIEEHDGLLKKKEEEDSNYIFINFLIISFRKNKGRING